jgi:SRSO17 transposase
MDEKEIRRLRPMLSAYLKRFGDCFVRSNTRAHLQEYVEGQLSNLQRKSVEPMAKAAGVAPRTLQEFLSQLKWDEDRARDRLQSVVAREHASPHAVGIVDETSFGKQGKKTPGVQRQWCNCRGTTDNCIVTVHLGYAADDFHCLLDGELYLPESWASDPDRCREAAIPETMTYRPKWQIALEEYDRARARGVVFAWMTFDEGYGGKPGFLRGLRDRGQRFVGEVPRSVTGWIKPPKVTNRPFRRHRRGRGRKTPRIVSGSPPARSVQYLLAHAPPLKDQAWKPYRIRDGEEGPMVWEAKHTRLYMADEKGLPDERPWHLLIARNVLNPGEVKYFVGYATESTPVGTQVLVGFSRFPIERCFEDEKTELGLDHYEGRRYPGLKRHLILTAISHLFLSQVRKDLGEKRAGTDRLPDPHGDQGNGPLLVAETANSGQTRREHQEGHSRHADQERHCPQMPHQDHTAEATNARHQADKRRTLHLGYELAL